MVCCQLLLHVNHSCMHAFKYGPETVWGAKDAAMNKIKFLPLWSLHLRGIIISSKYICSTLLCGSKCYDGKWSGLWEQKVFLWMGRQKPKLLWGDLGAEIWMKSKNQAFGYLSEVHCRRDEKQGRLEEQLVGLCCWRGGNNSNDDKNICRRWSTRLCHMNFYATAGNWEW